MKNTFRNILNASSAASSTFVQKMFEDEKENLTKDLNGVKFETTITILDENDTPIMVARSTSSRLVPEEPAEKETAEAMPQEAAQPAGEGAQAQNTAQTPFEQALYNAYYPVQYMMPYAVPGAQPQGATPPQMPYVPQGVMPPQMQYAPQSSAASRAVPVQQPASAPVKNTVAKASEDTSAAPQTSAAKAEPIRESAVPVEEPEVQAELPTESIREEVVREDISDIAAETKENANRNIPFTVVQETPEAAEGAEDAEPAADKRKKIELLLKKYIENN